MIVADTVLGSFGTVSSDQSLLEALEGLYSCPVKTFRLNLLFFFNCIKYDMLLKNRCDVGYHLLYNRVVLII